jgi:hypothetical protein
MASASSSSGDPRKRSRSTGPTTPLAVPLHEYCQKVALAHGAGTATHAPLVGCARKSGYASRPEGSMPFDAK